MFAIAALLLFSCTTEKAPLPFIGEIDFDEKGDTVYHTIPAFEMLNQEGKTITNKDFDGKIYVTDFFFTTCGTICPIMSNNLVRVQNEFINDHTIKILSFTVNPETDSVEILNAYAKKYGAINSKWSLCTGPKNKIYKLAQRGFLLIPPDVDVNDSSQFIHDERFNLVDAKGRIRGTYSGTDSLEVQQLIEDIKTLKDELHSAEQKN
ncbi:MAG: SCO family protein [Flavobacteriales bacterium]